MRLGMLKGARYGDFRCDSEVSVDGDALCGVNGGFDGHGKRSV